MQYCTILIRPGQPVLNIKFLFLIPNSLYNNFMVNPTRERIIEYLQTQRRCTVPQISDAFHMTRANMRYHLEKLVADGTVEVSRPLVPARVRGRPVQVYQLAVSSRPSNLPQLVDILLNQLTGEEQLQQIAAALAADGDIPRHVTQRISRVVQILNLKRYQARWEAHAQAPRIILRNCPYAAVLANHPELCRMDAYMLEQLLNLPVEQLARMDIFDSQPPACIFAVQVQSR